MKRQWICNIASLLAAASLMACGGSGGNSLGSDSAAGTGTEAGAGTGAGSAGGPGSGSGSGPGAAPVSSRECAEASYPSPEWTQCEQENFARTGEAPAEQGDPAFLSRWQSQAATNQLEFNARNLADPSWMSLQSGNTPITPLCTTWNQQCTGDPFRYPGGPGPNGQAFYDNEGEVAPVVFYDRGCARISGRIWRPRSGAGPFPGVVIQNGSVQAPEPLYWWAAQALVRAGYVVMTFDPRGQGRSDNQTPGGAQGSNANPVVFWEGLVDAIDFFRSNSTTVYPHNVTCEVSTPYATLTTASNPYFDDIDHDRLGIAGHSLGGTGVSVVQSYGATGAEPWPGQMDTANPVDAVVAWDGIFNPDTGAAGNATGNAGGGGGGDGSSTPAVVPQFPTLGQNGEYGLTPIAFSQPPDPETLIANFRNWQSAGVPVYEQTIRGSTHYEWSLLPTFPATSWCGDPATEQCDGGWGNSFAEHYTVAWFDRWLKQPGEPGFDTADDRLLDDEGEQGREKYSFRYQSARDFPDRSGTRQVCEDIRIGCP